MQQANLQLLTPKFVSNVVPNNQTFYCDQKPDYHEADDQMHVKNGIDKAAGWVRSVQ